MNQSTHLPFAFLLSLAAFALTSCQNRAASLPVEGEQNPMKPVQELPLNIAHRGARSLAPENTLQAALLGLQAGADMWELDVTLTAGGELVVIHDDTLERTSDARQVYPDRSPWAVGSFTLSELRQLDFGSWYVEKDPFRQIQSGAVSADQAAGYRGARIPTLEEAVAFTRDHDWRVNIEIKDATGTPADPLIVAAVLRQVAELGMGERVIISSFNHDYLRQVRDADPTIATAALVAGPHPDPLGLLRELGAVAYNPSLKTLDMDQLAAVRAAGYGVNVWTVNDPADMRRLIEAGATGIFTDFPQVLAGVLDEYRGK
jgi:glycerophosphoryl diester phosphodiesterase